MLQRRFEIGFAKHACVSEIGEIVELVRIDKHTCWQFVHDVKPAFIRRKRRKRRRSNDCCDYVWMETICIFERGLYGFFHVREEFLFGVTEKTLTREMTFMQQKW